MKKFEYKWESLLINVDTQLFGDIKHLRNFINTWLNAQGNAGWELISYPETEIISFQHFYEQYLKLEESKSDLNELKHHNDGFVFKEGYLKFCFKREIQKLPFCINCDHLLYCDKIKEWKSQYKDSIVSSMIQDTCCNKFK